jgi:hypothetical protein
MAVNTTQAIFTALQQAGAISSDKGLTAAQLADQFGFDKKITSTILGNLKRAGKARRVQEMRDNGYTHEYRYWVMPGTKAAFRRKLNGTNGAQSAQAMAAEVERSIDEYNRASTGGYLMQIKGPNGFRMEVLLAPGKLPQVIQAANGGQ